MLQQHASSMMTAAVFFGLCSLNVWLTGWRTPSPFVERPPKPRRAVFIRIASAVVICALVAGGLWLTGVMPNWQILWATSIFMVVLRHDKLWIKGVLVVTLVAASLFVISVPSVLAVYVVWFAPMLALAGYLPRLMVGLQSLTGRNHYWLMNVVSWLLLLVAAPFFDAWLMPYGAIDLIGYSIEWGMSDQFGYWANSPWPDFGELLLNSLPTTHVGIFTAYVLFGLLSALTAQARMMKDGAMIAIPLGMLGIALFVYHVWSWLFGPSNMVHLQSLIITGSQILGLFLVIVIAWRKGRSLPDSA